MGVLTTSMRFQIALTHTNIFPQAARTSQ
jgi:hypothetical protein